MDLSFLLRYQRYHGSCALLPLMQEPGVCINVTAAILGTVIAVIPINFEQFDGFLDSCLVGYSHHLCQYV